MAVRNSLEGVECAGGDAPKKVRHYSEARLARIGTPDLLKALAESALAILHERSNVACETLVDPVEVSAAAGTAKITYQGSKQLPRQIPDEIARPSDIGKNVGWVPDHRLMIRAPLQVLEIAWTTGEPLRMLYFSRGDWEKEILPV